MSYLLFTLVHKSLIKPVISLIVNVGRTDEHVMVLRVKFTAGEDSGTIAKAINLRILSLNSLFAPSNIGH